MNQFFQSTPIWVWPLFFLLLLLGLRARRARSVPIFVFYLMPLLGLLSIRSVASLSAPTWIWAVFAAAFFLGVGFGYRQQEKWLLSKKGGRAHLAGEDLTLLSMMILYFTNFAAGVIGAVAPDVYSSIGFVVIFTVATTIFGGSFAGRALFVWQR